MRHDNGCYVAELGQQTASASWISKNASCCEPCPEFVSLKGIAYEPSSDTIYFANAGVARCLLHERGLNAARRRSSLGEERD